MSDLGTGLEFYRTARRELQEAAENLTLAEYNYRLAGDIERNMLYQVCLLVICPQCGAGVRVGCAAPVPEAMPRFTHEARQELSGIKAIMEEIEV